MVKSEKAVKKCKIAASKKALQQLNVNAAIFGDAAENNSSEDTAADNGNAAADDDAADECIYIGATHFVNLLSSDDDGAEHEENQSEREKEKLIESEASDKDTWDSESGSENSAANKNESDDEEENVTEVENESDQKNINEIDDGEVDFEKRETLKCLEVNSKLNITEKIIAETTTNTEKENFEFIKEAPTKNEQQIEETSMFETALFVNLNTTTQTNVDNVEEEVEKASILLEKENESLPKLSSNYFSENNCEEIFPELVYLPNLENNLSDVNAMERELDHALEEIDAKAKVRNEKVTTSPVVQAVNVTKERSDQKNENKKNENENLEPNVLWSATQGLNRSIFEAKETNCNLAANNINSSEKVMKSPPCREYESETDGGDVSSSSSGSGSNSGSDSESTDESSTTEESEVESGELRDTDEEANAAEEPMAKKAKCE